ncbi:rod-binding protein [Brucella pseudogrignonensis]|uniref:Rod binding domain-containing protein n=1 Tax=Brucella pseudogrignonensis TaxID=419475 RepID=A0ABU1MAP1_9HYPH|nr:rod-binding protein [Brucella pseudogrignonensis]MDR6433110.1 Rod binding domain-containing protein [Brucella pseudogrignonensis]
MAINPPSDLVMDVARAADPQAYRVASERLKSMTAGSEVAFNNVINGSSDGSFSSISESLSSGVTMGAQQQNPASSAYRKFEAFMLQSFVQSMFTSDTSATFGKGIAGEYWKSMMSEAMANKMADTGGVGIARILEDQAQRKLQADNSATLALNGVMNDLGSGISENSVSKDIVHGFERQLIQQQLENNDGKDSAAI